MPPQLLRNQCSWCKKYFNTYDPSLKYCGTDCDYKHKYAILNGDRRPGLLLNQPKAKKSCKHCGIECVDDFCSHGCKTLYNRIPLHLQKKKSGKFLSSVAFEKEIEKSERKRVFDNRFAEKYIRGDTRDKI